MATFKKAMLRVGEKMHSADGVMETTPERLKHFAEQHKALHRNGYRVPSRWEHADDPADMIPLASEDYQKKLDGRHAVGEMVGFDLAPDGQSAELTFQITDGRAVEQADANRVMVSPIIAKAWRDGRGNTYSDFISHADLVERPVDYTQGPFERVPEMIACSLEKYVDLEAVRMAFDTEKEGEEKPAAEEKPETPAEPEKNPDAPPKATDKSKNTAILDGLKTKGIVLPSDLTFPAEIQDVLIAAINSSIAADVKHEEKSQEPEQEEKPTTVPSPGYATMSTEQKGNAAFAVLERKHREQIGRDLDELLKTGRCTPDEASRYKTALGAVRLSLDETGNEVPSDVEKFIASRQPVPAGTFWSDEQRTRLSTEAVAVDPPYVDERNISDAEAQKRAKEQLQRAGFPAK